MTTNQEFYNTQYGLIYRSAVAAGAPHPDVLANLGAAQSAWESGWGTSNVATSQNNYFGMMAGKDSYQSFSSQQASADAYVQLMKSPRYSDTWNANDPAAAAKAVVADGYNKANPNYASDITGTINGHGKDIPPGGYPLPDGAGGATGSGAGTGNAGSAASATPDAAVVPSGGDLPDNSTASKNGKTNTIVSRMPTHEPWSGHPKPGSGGSSGGAIDAGGPAPGAGPPIDLSKPATVMADQQPPTPMPFPADQQPPTPMPFSTPRQRPKPPIMT